MRFDTAFKPVHSFEYWRPIVTLNEDEVEQVAMEYAGEKHGQLVPLTGGMATLVSTFQMEIDGEVRGLTDRAGRNVFSLGIEDFEYIMFVSSVDVVMDPFGNLMGYKHNLRRGTSLANND